MRDLDRTLEALRQALGPVTGASYPGSKDNRRQHLARLERMAYCVRHCCYLAMQDAPAVAQSAQSAQWARLSRTAGALAARLDAAAALLDSPAQRLQPQDALPPLVLPDAAQIGGQVSAIPLQLALRWLAETDETLRAIRDELPAPGKP
jgi:hypothetical protein